MLALLLVLGPGVFVATRTDRLTAGREPLRSAAARSGCLSTPRADIYFHDGEDALARRLARVIDEVAPEVDRRLGRTAERTAPRDPRRPDGRLEWLGDRRPLQPDRDRRGAAVRQQRHRQYQRLAADGLRPRVHPRRPPGEIARMDRRAAQGLRTAADSVSQPVRAGLADRRAGDVRRERDHAARAACRRATSACCSTRLPRPDASRRSIAPRAR